MTAFVLDVERQQAPPDGMMLSGIPGLWTNDRPVAPEALGLTLAEVRAAVKELGLPLKEVSVREGAALTAWEDRGKLGSSPAGLVLEGAEFARERDAQIAAAHTTTADPAIVEESVERSRSLDEEV